MSVQKEKQKCLWCGKEKWIDQSSSKSGFDKNSFMKNGFNPICKTCKKNLNDLDSFKNYLDDSGIEFNQKTWDKASKEILDKLKNKYKDEIPNNLSKSIIQKIINKYFSLSNLNESFKSTPKVQSSNNGKKIYSKRWMGYYTEEELDYLESYLNGLYNDFKIITTNHKDYAMKIAKASLHMDKCYQDLLSGKSGADSRYKTARETFDALSKSAAFAESQRSQNDVSLGCFGKVFEKVEQRKWIPKHTPLEKDAFDKLINQFSHINKSL